MPQKSKTVLSDQPTNKELGELIIHLNSSTKEELKNYIDTRLEAVELNLTEQISALAQFVHDTCATKEELQKTNAELAKTNQLMRLHINESRATNTMQNARLEMLESGRR